jgi:hypothetical protein
MIAYYFSSFHIINWFCNCGGSTAFAFALHDVSETELRPAIQTITIVLENRFILFLLF